ncbi:MAG: hypothetical protein U1E51_02005 [Candidatus Binatia bacterium]|nr:hypothetical protein [Candidatus Binatia bacterium]
MPELYGPEQLIHQLDVAMKRDTDDEAPDDADYWKVRAVLEIARQIERLEATIRTRGIEAPYKDVLFHDPKATCIKAVERGEQRCPGHAVAVLD